MEHKKWYKAFVLSKRPIIVMPTNVMTRYLPLPIFVYLKRKRKRKRKRKKLLIPKI